MKNSRLPAALALLISVALSTTGCAPSGSSAKPTLVGSGACLETERTIDLVDLKLGYGLTSDGPSAEWGISESCFQVEGLNVSGTVIEDLEAIAALENGTVDIVAMNLSDYIVFNANGDWQGVFVASSTGYSAGELEAAKNPPKFSGELLLQLGLVVDSATGINSWGDLEGKTIAVGQIGAVETVGIQEAILAAGGDPSGVEFLVMPMDLREGAVARGDVDAAAVVGRYVTSSVENGLSLLGYPGAYYYVAGPVKIWMTSQDVLAEKREQIFAFRDAILAVNKHLQDLATNSDSFRSILVEKFGSDAEKAAATTLPNFWIEDPSREAILELSEKLLRTGSISKLPDLSVFDLQ